MAEGRMEMSEVMAIQFTDMFLAQKKRDSNAQSMLVKGLRILCDVFLARGKAKRGISTVKILHRERKKLVQILTKGAPHLLSKMTPASEDYRRAGNIFALAGKQSSAIKAFRQCEKLSPNHLASALEACQLFPDNKKLIHLFVKNATQAGPVVMYEGVFYLQPETSPKVKIDNVIRVLQSALEQSLGPLDACSAQLKRITDERQAIERGEAAANARLQAAMDLLKPQHDYYEY